MIQARIIAPFVGETGIRVWNRIGGDSLKPILPNLYYAENEYVEMLEKGKSGRKAEENGSTSRPNFSELVSEGDKKRWRYARSVGVLDKRLGEIWGRSLPLYITLLPREMEVIVGLDSEVVEVKRNVVRVLEEMHVFEQANSDELYSLLKMLSDVAKKNGDMLFPGYWKYLVNLEVLGGFLPSKDIADFSEDLVSWVSGDVVHEMPDAEGGYSESDFLNQLGKGFDDFFGGATSIDVANERAMSMEEFASSPANWSVSGTSSRPDKRVEYTVRGNERVYKTKKSKWSTGLTSSFGEVLHILTTRDENELRGRAKAIQKRETGKVRAVVTSEDATYIRMTFISKWLEEAFAGDTRTTLFMTSSQVVDMWNNLSLTIGTDVRIPLDQSHFDWQQNKRMFDVFFLHMAKFIRNNATIKIRDELLHVLESLRLSLVEIPSTLKLHEGEVEIDKGVLSGWRWTAFLDTAFNWAEFFCAKEVLNRFQVQGRVYSLVAQGDDDQVSVSSYGYAAALSVAYSMMGFEINPGKFFIAADRDEYLRQVVQKNLVCGYPARGMTSVLWRGPETRDPPAGEVRFGESVKAWNVLMGRGLDEDACMRCMRIDLSQGNGLTMAQVDKILHTPAVFGGSGLFPWGEEWMSVSSAVTTQEPRVNIGSLHGLKSELSGLREVGIVLPESYIREEVISRLEFAKAERVTVREMGIEERKRRRIKALQRPFGSTQSPSRAPRQERWTVGVLPEAVLRYKVRERDWNWIRTQWVDPTAAALSERIEKEGGRRVWIGWLEGKLPGGLPTVVTHSDLQCSNIYNRLYGQGLTYLFTLNNWNWTMVERMALSCEWETRRLVLEETVRLGG